MRMRMGIAIALGGTLLVSSAFAKPSEGAGKGADEIKARDGVHNPFKGKIHDKSGPNLNSGNGAFIGGTSVDSDRVNGTIIDPAAPWGVQPWTNALTPRQYFDLEGAIQDIRNLLAAKKPGEGLTSKDFKDISNLSYLKDVMSNIHDERLKNEGSKDKFKPSDDEFALMLARVKLRPYYAYQVKTEEDASGKKHTSLVPKQVNVVDHNLWDERKISYAKKIEVSYQTHYYYVRVFKPAGRCGCRGYWDNDRRSYQTRHETEKTIATKAKIATNQTPAKLTTRVASKTEYKTVKYTVQNKKWVSYYQPAGRCGCHGYWTGYWYRWNETKTAQVPYTVKDRVFAVDAPNKHSATGQDNKFVPTDYSPDSDGNVTMKTDEDGNPVHTDGKTQVDWSESKGTANYLDGTIAAGVNPQGFN